MKNLTPAPSPTDREFRLLLVSPRYAPAVGGVERHVEMLATRVADRGVSVEVVCTDPTGVLPRLEWRDGVLVRRFPTLFNDAILLLSPQLGHWLRRNAGSYDVIHGHSYHAPVALQASLAARRHGRPFVMTPHYHGGGHSPWLRALHVAYTPAGVRLLRRADAVFCVSEAEQALVRARCGFARVRTSVVPNGVDLEEIEAAATAPRSARVRIVSAGRLEEYKQTGRLLEALAQMPPDFELVVVGDGRARSALEAQAKRLGVHHRVHFAGQVIRPELLGLLKSADAFVSLSRHESFGLTLLEAAAAGAAVVASDIPAHREVADMISAPPSLIRVDARPSTVASAVRRVALGGPRPPSQRTGLPTWDAAAERILLGYAGASGRSTGTVSSARLVPGAR